MSKCTEGGEEERRAKEDRNICADLDGGSGGSDPQRAAIKDLIGFQTVFYKMSVVEILDIKFVICYFYSCCGKRTVLGRTLIEWQRWGDVISEAAWRFAAAHGDVLKVPAGSHCFRRSVTPEYTGPQRPSASAGMWLVSSQMAL